MNKNLFDQINKLSNNEFESHNNFSPMENYLNTTFEKNIQRYDEKLDESHYNIIDLSGNSKNAFVKYITLVDYVKYLIGKYKDCNTNILPEKESNSKTQFQKIINSPQNYAYVDTMFYYISNLSLIHI